MFPVLAKKTYLQKIYFALKTTLVLLRAGQYLALQKQELVTIEK